MPTYGTTGTKVFSVIETRIHIDLATGKEKSLEAPGSIDCVLPMCVLKYVLLPSNYSKTTFSEFGCNSDLKDFPIVEEGEVKGCGETAGV